jgi:hypothetical protein
MDGRTRPSKSLYKLYSTILERIKTMENSQFPKQQLKELNLLRFKELSVQPNKSRERKRKEKKIKTQKEKSDLVM